MASTQSGFTLIEVLVAAAVLALGVLGMVSAIQNAVVADDIAENHTIATKACQQVAEQLLALPHDQLAAVGDLPAKNRKFDVTAIPGLPTTQIGSYSIVDITSEVNPGGPADGVLRITVEVEYVGGRGIPGFHAVLVTEKAKPGP